MSVAGAVPRVPAAAAPGLLARLWLFVRPTGLVKCIALVVFGGLTVAHLLTFAWLQHERATLSRSMMAAYLAADVAASMAILERVPAAERPSWLPKLARQNYAYVLRPAAKGEGVAVVHSLRSDFIVATLAKGVGRQRVRGSWSADTGDDPLRFEIELELGDGTPLTLVFDHPPSGISVGTASVLVLQMLVLGLATWAAVRLATRPLERLAQAADDLTLERPVPLLEESGCDELARAARAFNTMQRRLAAHVAERTQILAAVSHDLRTPIARMRLRAELPDSPATREKLLADLAEMQALVEDGLAYARSSQAPTEPLQQVDVAALIDSLAGDYHDAGQAVEAPQLPPLVWPTRAQALRRLLGNLLDNALKFAGAASIEVEAVAQGLSIRVLDRGPGIPDDQLQAVMLPFARLEPSRSRETGGVGLGLAIARQLAQSLGGELRLANREGGGLLAELLLPPQPR